MMRATRAPGASRAAADWEAIGTAVRLVVTDPARLAAGRRLLEAQLSVLDVACSRFRADSELAGVERAAPAQVHISEVLADAVAVALQAAEMTDGDLDPTVATAIAALGYDRDFRLVAKDGPPLRLSVTSRPNWRDIRLDRRSRVLALPRGVRLDLGATAKASAADRAAGRLATLLGCGVLVSLGGDIATGGPPPEGGWRVRVQDVTGHPDEPPAGPAEVIAIDGYGLASSGTAARQWRRGDLTLHHILDPRSRLPVTPVWRTVSVLADTALLANIASTAAIIRGASAPGWIEGLGLAGRLVSTDGHVRRLAGWPQPEAA